MRSKLKKSENEKREEDMRNRGFVAAVAGVVGLGMTIGGALAEPKTNMLHQWDSGSDGGRQMGANFHRRPYRQYARQAPRRRDRGQCAARRAAQRP
jgi:hypothetical protein